MITMDETLRASVNTNRDKTAAVRAAAIDVAIRRNYNAVVQPKLEKLEAQVKEDLAAAEVVRDAEKAAADEKYNSKCEYIRTEAATQKNALIADERARISAAVGKQYDDVIAAYDRMLGGDVV
jgi:type II secretory pathway component HofQ